MNAFTIYDYLMFDVVARGREFSLIPHFPTLSLASSAQHENFLTQQHKY